MVNSEIKTQGRLDALKKFAKSENLIDLPKGTGVPYYLKSKDGKLKRITFHVVELHILGIAYKVVKIEGIIVLIRKIQ